MEQYADAAAVRHAASALLSDVNLRSRQDRIGSITVDQLCEHFEQSEMRSAANLWSVATQRTYRGYIRRWIRPRWGSRSLDEIKAVEVEAWLHGINLARASRAKIRNVLCVLFNHACRDPCVGPEPAGTAYVKVPLPEAVRVIAVGLLNSAKTDWSLATGPGRNTLHGSSIDRCARSSRVAAAQIKMLSRSSDGGRF